MSTLKVKVSSMFRNAYVPASLVNVSIMIEGYSEYADVRCTNENGFAEFPVNESCTVNIYINNMMRRKVGVYYKDEVVDILI